MFVCIYIYINSGDDVNTAMFERSRIFSHTYELATESRPKSSEVHFPNIIFEGRPYFGRDVTMGISPNRNWRII